MAPSLYTMKTLLLLTLVALTAPATVLASTDRPNVLFIAVDDLNDWIGVFGGHPEARTPNLDRFAAEGATVFQNAHCPGPVCGPSRSAVLSASVPAGDSRREPATLARKQSGHV